MLSQLQIYAIYLKKSSVACHRVNAELEGKHINYI